MAIPSLTTHRHLLSVNGINQGNLKFNVTLPQSNFFIHAPYARTCISINTGDAGKAGKGWVRAVEVHPKPTTA
jgi:hypothetical protein